MSKENINTEQSINGKQPNPSAHTCKRCGRALLEHYTNEYCIECQTQLLFDDVRDYIRSHDVNEYDVAKHFDIRVEIVHHWIKEGRIEYKEQKSQTIATVFCQRCGEKVSFGTLSPKCLKELKEQRKGYAVAKKKNEDENRMHFLG